MLIGILLPLWVVLCMLGSQLGLGPAQIEGRSVYLVSQESPEPAHRYGGMACSPRFGYDFGYCDGLPDETAILYHWGDSVNGYNIESQQGLDFERFELRHEIEHLDRGPDGPDSDRNNEAAADAAGCAVSPGRWCQ